MTGVPALHASLHGARTLWSDAHRLGLNAADSARYALSYYGSRRPLASRFAPTRIPVTLPNGTNAILRPNGVDCHTIVDIFVRKLYDAHAQRVSRVLDLGANIGLATLFFASKFPDAQFACVEPSPENCAVLLEVLLQNHIRATVVEAAIGIESGEAELFMGADPTGYSLVPPSASACRRRVVRQIDMASLLQRLGWGQVDLLKIDIEGYEAKLLRNRAEWLTSVRHIVGEAHGHAGYGFNEVVRDLQPYGFDVKLRHFDSQWQLTVFEAERRT